jgi:hypothetical protein
VSELDLPVSARITLAGVRALPGMPRRVLGGGVRLQRCTALAVRYRQAMRVTPIRIAFVVLVLGWLTVRSASACGFWSMHDLEKKLDVGWLINAASITRDTGTDHERRLAALYLDIDNPGGIRVVADKKVIYDLKQSKILRYGKVIGSVDADGNATIGKVTYAISFSDLKDFHGMPAWTVTVKRGNDVIAETKTGSALCAGLHRDPPMTEAEQQDEVRRRVIYYLAWRETGM